MGIIAQKVTEKITRERLRALQNGVYHNRQTYRGRWMWAIEDGKAISLDGMFFKRTGYSKYDR